MNILSGRDFSTMPNNVIQRLFDLMRNNDTIHVEYIKPFVINEHLWRIDFMRTQNIKKRIKKLGPNYKKKIRYDMYDMLKNEINIAKFKIDELGRGGYDIIGYLPWKMFDCDIILMERDNNYINNIRSAIAKGNIIVDDINNAKRIHDKMTILDKHFPPK